MLVIICTANMNVGSVAMSRVAQDHFTSAWTWGDISRHTSQCDGDLIVQSQIVGAILRAKTICLSIGNNIMEPLRAKVLKSGDIFMDVTANAHILVIFWASHSNPGYCNYLGGKSIMASGFPPQHAHARPSSMWTWNDIPRHDNGHTLGIFVSRGRCTSVWTWSNIPRDGSERSSVQRPNDTISALAKYFLACRASWRCPVADDLVK
jgi:hypothetical protein